MLAAAYEQSIVWRRTVTTRYAEQRPAGPLDITVVRNGDTIAAGQVPISAPLLFTTNDCLDIGTCLGSPVSMDYRERAPFPFETDIHEVHVAHTYTGRQV